MSNSHFFNFLNTSHPVWEQKSSDISTHPKIPHTHMIITPHSSLIENEWQSVICQRWQDDSEKMA